MEECVHGGDPHACPPCQRSSVSVSEYGPVFIAEYDSECAEGCGERIEPGDYARMGPDGAAHEDCAL